MSWQYLEGIVAGLAVADVIKDPKDYMQWTVIVVLTLFQFKD